MSSISNFPQGFAPIVHRADNVSSGSVEFGENPPAGAQRTPAPTLNGVPAELKTKIMGFLDTGDLSNLRATNTIFAAILTRPGTEQTPSPVQRRYHADRDQVATLLHAFDTDMRLDLPNNNRKARLIEKLAPHFCKITLQQREYVLQELHRLPEIESEAYATESKAHALGAMGQAMAYLTKDQIAGIMGATLATPRWDDSGAFALAGLAAGVPWMTEQQQADIVAAVIKLPLNRLKKYAIESYDEILPALSAQQQDKLAMARDTVRPWLKQ